MATPPEILALALQQATQNLYQPRVKDHEIVDRVNYICQANNRAGVRMLLACLLAKIHRPEVDIRKPYTEIGTADVYSGRFYDEQYIAPFVIQHELPCNRTTAFLTPALRNITAPLVVGVEIAGTPRQLYRELIYLLDAVQSDKISPQILLTEIVRRLLLIRDEQAERINSLVEAVRAARDGSALSAEAIVTLLEQHLASPRSSRLPVLMITAAYRTASEYLGERILHLQAHNAADQQTGALGDVEVTLINDEKVIATYEMKARRVTDNDIDQALYKLVHSNQDVQHYIFITTDRIDVAVKEYAATIYERTGGIEIVVLDCISFVRHFLHLFHRLRMQFLDEYQELLLVEPNSSVSQPLKEVFLALRRAAEIGI